ncbi:MAG: hypothetical protein HY913_10460 [Desulfomonile tiedjei]|nr:hypothetical protein [Desulfomonile tiedjei]
MMLFVGGPEATASGFRRNKRGRFVDTHVSSNDKLKMSKAGNHLLSLRDPDAMASGPPADCSKNEEAR